MIYINIGSNLNSSKGNRFFNLKKSLELITLENIKIIKISSIYETRALAKEYEQKVMKRRSTLLESRFMAITSGDRELLRETNRRLAEFRRLYPRLINSRTYESSFKSRQSAQQEYTYGSLCHVYLI